MESVLLGGTRRVAIVDGRALIEGDQFAGYRVLQAGDGDAGLEMIMGELATLRDLALPVVIVVFIDASLALIELKQRKGGLRNMGVDFGATDFPAVAEALGGRGVAVRDRAALAEAVKAGLAEDGRFTVIADPQGGTFYARLLEGEAPKTCATIKSRLPFEYLFQQSIVSGQAMVAIPPASVSP